MTRPDSGSRAALCDFLDSRADELVACARSLVSISSENPPGDERAIAAEVLRWIDRLSLGGTSQQIESAPHRVSILWRDDVRPPLLTLCGHLDTVPTGSPNLWKVEDGQGVLAGRGSVDMKAAVAAMLFAAHALETHYGETLGAQLLFVADEERGGVLGAKHIASDRVVELGEAVIICEPSYLGTPRQIIATSSRGIARFALRAHGIAGHSSAGTRERYDNATLALAAALVDLEQTLDLSSHDHRDYPDGPTVVLALCLEGGVRNGVIPAEAEAYCEIRTLPGTTQAQFEREIEHAVAQTAGRLGARLSVEFDRSDTGWFEPVEIDRDHPAVHAAGAAVEEVTGRPAQIGGLLGACDARHFLHLAGVPSISALGPGDLALGHGYAEALPEAEVIVAAKVYALAAVEYAARRSDAAGGLP